MEELINTINKHCLLNEQEELLLHQTLRTLHFPKGSTVIEEGKIDDSIYFIKRGVWRAHIERDGEDRTLWFAVSCETVFSSWGHIRGLPSRLTISSSSNSEAIELKKSTIQKLLESSQSFANWLHLLYTDILLNTDDQLVDISYPKAEKRYLAFIKKMPEIIQHVPLKEIAGYIGVTPQSLSRIRAKIG